MKYTLAKYKLVNESTIHSHESTLKKFEERGKGERSYFHKTSHNLFINKAK